MTTTNETTLLNWNPQVDPTKGTVGEECVDGFTMPLLCQETFTKSQKGLALKGVLTDWHHKVCPTCGNGFMANKRVRKYCSYACFAKSPEIVAKTIARLKCKPNLPPANQVTRPWDGKTRPEIAGRNHPMFGKKHGKSTRKSISQKIKDAYANGVYSTPERYARMCSAQKKAAKNRPNYKGGITPFRNQIRGCSLYKRWRDSVFQRDNWTCCRCGVRGGDLNAHHRTPFREIVERYGISELEQAIACAELWDISNGETLCESCHSAIPK